MRTHLTLLFALLAGCAATGGKPVPQKSEPGMTWIAQALPSGKTSTSAILVERGTPTQVPLGKPFDYEIRVTNLAEHDLCDIVVDEELAPSVTLNHAEPAPAATEGRKVRWDVGTLAKGATASIKVNATPGATGDVSNRCEVRYRALVGGTVMVVEPKLAIVSEIEPLSLVNEPVGVRFKVTNPGTGSASGVVISGELPKGVTTLDGQSAVKIDVGNLPAGASRDFVVQVKGTEPGAHALKAVATSEDGLSAETGETKLEVRRAKLEIQVATPADWLLDRALACTLKVRNAGDGDARNAQVEVTLAEGIAYVGASEAVQASAGAIRWDLGTLAAGQERALELKVSASKPIEVELGAKVSADYAEAAAATAKTRFQGVAALSLEVVDNEDPIAVGSEVTYTITVRNQGSAPARNVRVECASEDGMALVGADGATKREGSGEPAKSFAFVSLDALAPGQTATWWVKVKAEKAGDVRFRASVTSGDMERPVGETEATKFYQ
ncbi:MAG TPA: hypothetical protein VFY93_09560 [Planctomycetota bacterium]|nr:hypothetical protein [Planctomycetota bacterium]